MTSAAVSKRLLAISNRFRVSFTVADLSKLVETIGRAKIFGLAGKGFVQRSSHVHIGAAHRIFLHLPLLDSPTSRGILRLRTVKAGLGEHTWQERSKDVANKIKKYQEGQNLK